MQGIYDAQFLSPFELNDAQMISLEKLIIELKAMEEDMDQFRGAS
jgi:hypothetical protein